MNENDLKRKLRRLKKQEIALRFGHGKRHQYQDLLWHRYFSTSAEDEGVRYPLALLLVMNHLVRKEIFDHYFYQVYYQYYLENGLPLQAVVHHDTLTFFGLSITASPAEVKERFRSLAMEHHPDKGGDPEAFRQLMEAYKEFKREHHY